VALARGAAAALVAASKVDDDEEQTKARRHWRSTGGVRAPGHGMGRQFVGIRRRGRRHRHLGLLGPVYHFSDTWQLVINTGTTIITFLMVFLIQRSQNKDSLAIHLKLNEIVAALEGASNRLINVEDLWSRTSGHCASTIGGSSRSPNVRTA